MSDFVKVRVPGTTANCGPGFDVMGIACSIYNELELKLLEEKNLCIEIYGDGATNIPCDERNMVWCSIEKLLAANNPATIAVALLPRPRDRGTLFVIFICAP